MKKPSEIWDSFSEAKGEKRAYVVGIGEGKRSMGEKERIKNLFPMIIKQYFGIRKGTIKERFKELNPGGLGCRALPPFLFLPCLRGAE